MTQATAQSQLLTQFKTALKTAVPLRTLLVAAIPVCLIVLMTGSEAVAQSIDINLGEGSTLSGRVVQLILLMTVISLAPSILVMMTSFTRMVIVFSILRSALGVQQSPPNQVIISLALFLTGYVMAPTLEAAYDAGIAPLINEEINEQEAMERALVPMKAFMISQVRDTDIALFVTLRGEEVPENINDIDIFTLVPAFMTSELRRAFEIGFLIYIPFIVIDMTVASVLMSMGMMMLPPVMIALPFKLIFFVLVDGWNMVVSSLVQSFGTIPPPPMVG